MDTVTGLLIFGSTSVALKTERALKDAGVPCAVIPTPVEITSDCGISLLIKEQWIKKAKEALASAGCEGHTLLYPFKPGVQQKQGG
jgi:hypothetical protein